jgi:CRISPR-associated protein Cmr4
MNYDHALVLYQTITPLHVGCGQDVGVVDLPVIRERTTGYPFIPGSGIRGSVRDLLDRWGAEKRDGTVSLLFGPRTAEAGDEDSPRHAGCVAVHDAKILLFPVRSDQALFLWITCPSVLRRFSRDLEVFVPGLDWSISTEGLEEEQALAPSGFDSPLYLEEFSFRLKELEDSQTIQSLTAWGSKIGDLVGAPEIGSRIVLVSDRTFHYFISHATMILQHNRLTSAKTVEGGMLFSVEAVPPEAVFYGFFGATDSRRPVPQEAPEPRLSREKVLETLRSFWTQEGGGASGYLHLGGDESTGLGVTRLAWAPGETR